MQQLEEFSSSFRGIGGESANAAGSQYSRENFPLPGNEPPSPFPQDAAALPDAAVDPNDFDFSAFLNPPAFDARDGDAGLPADLDPDGSGDFGSPEAFGEPESRASPPEASAPDGFEDEPGLGEIPPDLLSGFAGDIEADGLPVDETLSTLPAADETAAGTPVQTGFSAIDLSDAIDLGNEGSPARAAEAEPPAGPAGGEEDLSLGSLLPDFPGEEAAGEADTGSKESQDLPGGFGESGFGTDLGSGFGAGLDTGDTPDTSDFDAAPDTADFGAAPDTADFGAAPDTADFGAGFQSIDLSDAGEEPGKVLSGADVPGETGDGFDSFNLGGETWTPPEGVPPETPDFSTQADDFTGSGFSLEGFDDIDGPGKGAAGVSADIASEDVEEIHLGEDEFRRLQETLSAYPLNLRIACEELIAEQAVAPDLMSAMIKLLVRGAPAKEAAALAGKILGRTIPIPKGFAKQTGADLEEEQASFGYIFIKKFLPVLRIFLFAALAMVSAGYLAKLFIVDPFIANGIYREGYERIFAGDYSRANELFNRAYERRRVKNWFYRYAQAFREVRNYERAAEKYEQLLRAYPRDKKGALYYAGMETYRQNYKKADEILRHNILDYAVNDREALIAAAENNLAWAGEDPSRYEEARAAYARLIGRYGRQDIFLEGMLKYFIRTDNLGEVLPLQSYFMSKEKKRKISVAVLAEMGGYLLDKRFEKVQKVPDEYVDQIDGIRDILLRAIKEGPAIPEAYYHLARYYNRYGSTSEERATLESAVRIFNAAEEETPKRAGYRIDTHRMYAEVLINEGEFFPAEEQLVQGVRLFEDALTRGILGYSPMFGRLYADLGDLAFYSQDGDMETVLRHYREAEANGWAPPEIQYRIGVAHYELSRWEQALQRFFALSTAFPNNRRLIYALGNASYMRGNYFAAQGYYNQLMDILGMDRIRYPNLMPGSRPEEQDLAERIMVADNNMGVTLETLTRITGNTGYRSRALGFFAESIRAWDTITRDPESMSRARPIRDLYGPGVNLAYLNTQNILSPASGYDQRIFMRIDRDMPEPSAWETLVPRDYRLSENLYSEE
ncbi:MAG: tetratricopeptide repeat protein [Treponema sp.]|nr:tetratricopeptide repeat protein [Treponema sp.]